MSKRFHFWCMVVNAFFVVTNSFFILTLERPTMNVVAALLCLIGFCIALSSYLKTEEQ